MFCVRCAGVVLTACALLSGAALPPPASPLELVVTAVAFEESAAGSGQEALAALLRVALEAGGVHARVVPPPSACMPPNAPDSPTCMRAALALLAQGALHAALLPAAPAALPPTPRLRDAGVEVAGALEEAAGARRDCWASGTLRSLSELAREESAAPYRLAPEDAVALTPELRYFCSVLDEPAGSPRPCPGSLATALVGPASEARVVQEVGAAGGLRLQALVLGADWDAARALLTLKARGARAVVCGRGLDANALRAVGARRLGPPPCDAVTCAFDARPLLKLSAARELARSPGAARALDRLRLPAGGAVALALRARTSGPETAARSVLATLEAERGPREARVAVLIPRSTRREVGDARALVAAAQLAEEDEARSAAASADAMRYKVELVDSGCAAPRVFKYLTDALGAEFHALSGVAGPLCAGAFSAVSRQSGALALPVLAYSPQASGAGVLLAAGAAESWLPALASLLAALGWRRAALLSEAGGRAALDTARLGLELAVHVELPEGEDLAEDLVERWAVRAARLEARVLLVVVEDARAARAALCAGARVGLTPARGAAYVLLGASTLLQGWLREESAGASDCPLRAQADGHLRLTPAWAARWEESGARGEWAQRWRLRAAAAPRPLEGQEQEAPPATAALLYDALRLWAGTVSRLLRDHPEALDDLHRADRVASLIADAIGTGYVGLTGTFEWEGLARRDALLVQQWRGGRALPVGRWDGATLQLDAAALHWAAPGGRRPDDGSERCALAGLASALGADCGAAWLCATALALLALGVPVALGVWRCHRRAARDHRARLAALGMRALGPRAGEPDRWELPRERVVINRKLGAGAFGTVYGGHALLGAGEARAWAAVAVKTLKAGAGTEEKLDFLSEAEALKRFSHSRVVRLLGVVTRTEPVCTIMEYMLYGDLKGYLVARRHLAAPGTGAGAEADDVTPTRLTGMARDAALALEYLARLRYVHRDVAARNCLVSASRRVKLADFGMTRVVFENDYYRFGRKGMLPVRWMAPESLALGVFSSASDVWSFGVLLYEIVTFGALPYRGLANAEVLERAKAGSPPPLPPALEPQLEALIRSCWRRERQARPTAAALAGFLGEWPRLLTPSLAAPDALDEPLPSRATERPKEGRWTSWAAPTSAGTDSTYLSAPSTPPPVAPADTDPFLQMPC